MKKCLSKIYIAIVISILIAGCGSNDDQNNEWFVGTVEKVFRDKSMKSASIRLASGQKVIVFLTDEDTLKVGQPVEVFRYSDHKGVFYLKR